MYTFSYEACLTTAGHNKIHIYTKNILKCTQNLKFIIVWTKQATMKALYNIYIVPDVYYCNKYEIIVYTHFIQCSQCHNYNVLVVPHARRSL